MPSSARITRRWWLPVGLITVMSGFRLRGETLAIRLSGDMLKVSKPKFHFLEGATLQRLRDGAKVSFVFQLSLSLDSNLTIKTRTLERFVLSYDIWDESFSVTRGGALRRTKSHMVARAAEIWCVEQMEISPAGLPKDKPFWLRLEVRAEDLRDPSPLFTDAGISFSRVIEIFSRPAKGQETRWHDEAGPLRLDELRKAASQGTGGA